MGLRFIAPFQGADDFLWFMVPGVSPRALFSHAVGVQGSGSTPKGCNPGMRDENKPTRTRKGRKTGTCAVGLPGRERHPEGVQ